MTLLLGGVVVALAVFAVVRRVDVRLTLILAGLALGMLAFQTQAVFQAFLLTLCNEQFVVPICSAMGFAYVLRHTGCDQHLVQLLADPVRRVRLFAVPGAVLVGFVVNIPIISQTSTAVTIGPVLVPLLRAARLSPVTIGAALLLGASLGGELLNPGAPELQTVARALHIEATECVAWILPLLLAHLALAVAVFWFLSARAEAKWRREEAERAERTESLFRKGGETPPLPGFSCRGEVTSPPSATDSEAALWKGRPPAEEKEEPPFRVNWLKAAVPLLPLVLLFVTGPPLQFVAVPRHWLIGPKDPPDARADSRLIGAAMLIGTAAAALVGGRAKMGGAGTAFFDGAGYAYTHIISLIVGATCFSEGVKQIGLAALLGDGIRAAPGFLTPSAAVLPLLFAVLCGSGMASTQGLFDSFKDAALSLGVSAIGVGAVVSIAAAAGRTMSPVAAVTLMSASLSGADPLAITRRVAVPLLVGLAAVVLLHLLLPG
jgi:C4-dicarboxylate transporter, DcuC family